MLLEVTVSLEVAVLVEMTVSLEMEVLLEVTVSLEVAMLVEVIVELIPTGLLAVTAVLLLTVDPRHSNQSSCLYNVLTHSNSMMVRLTCCCVYME